MIRVEIDPHSGFCGGVIRAIGKAEELLAQEGKLFSLGAIVHNEEELLRLERKGLVTIDRDDLEQSDGVEGENLLVRAHGEPPEVYRMAREKGFRIVDCTCPVVLKLQRHIREAHARMTADGVNGRVVIFGKIGHPEVLGLVGQTGGDALVIESLAGLERQLAAGALDTARPVEIFSQTTMSPDGYKAVCKMLSERMADRSALKIHHTICTQVATRHKELSEFALGHDIIIFVSGKTSSNGEVLCNLCKRYNIRTYSISSISDIQPGWFTPDDRVGVCGATSTPKWLLEKAARAIENLH